MPGTVFKVIPGTYSDLLLVPFHVNIIHNVKAAKQQVLPVSMNVDHHPFHYRCSGDTDICLRTLCSMHFYEAEHHDLQKMDDLILVSKIALGRQPRLRWGQETQAVGIMGQPPVTSPQGILSLLGLTRKSFTFEKQKLSSPPEHPGSRSVFLAFCFKH